MYGTHMLRQRASMGESALAFVVLLALIRLDFTVHRVHVCFTIPFPAEPPIAIRAHMLGLPLARERDKDVRRIGRLGVEM